MVLIWINEITKVSMFELYSLTSNFLNHSQE